MKEPKSYTPRADYAWVPAFATVIFIVGFMAMVFLPLAVEESVEVITYMEGMSGKMEMFLSLCLGFFLRGQMDNTKKK